LLEAKATEEASASEYSLHVQYEEFALEDEGMAELNSNGCDLEGLLPSEIQTKTIKLICN